MTVRLSGDPAVGVVVVAARVTFESAPEATFTARSGELEMAPSRTSIVVAPLRYSRITPFLEEETEATPELKLIAVAEPKATAVPELLTTVGLVPPGLAEAPEKMRLCEPV